MTDTLPSDDSNDYAVQLSPSVHAPTGAAWVHKDYVKVLDDWAIEQHVGPPKASEAFGDVESWAEYVKRFGEGSNLLTWNSQGLHAVLDYHGDDEHAGRLQWFAKHPFERSPEWKAWMAIADGHGRGQREAIEALEDRGAEIVDPDPSTLMALLRNLRTTVNKSATAELRPDGTTSVQWIDNNNVAARGGTADLPPEFTINIPVLKGHPVLYALKVRLRVSVNDQAKLAFRFTIPNAERALEDVFADRVAAAKTALGDGFALLRAAG